MPNGIVSQLPSSHLFIHRVPAKLFNGVCAPRSELLPATALVCKLILTDLTSGHLDGADLISGRNTTFIHLSVFVPAEAPLASQRCRVSFQNPARPLIHYSEARQGSGVHDG